MEQFQVGDVVEVVNADDSDNYFGIEVGNQYKVVNIFHGIVYVYVSNKPDEYPLLKQDVKLISRGAK